MNREESEPKLIRRADYVAAGGSLNEITRRVKSGEIVKVAPGVYAPSAIWAPAFPELKHTLRVHAQQRRLKSPTFSHYSAAGVHVFSLLGPWPDKVHVTECRESKRGGRSEGAVVRHRAPLSAEETTIVDGISVTTVPRTAYDLACQLPFTDAVAMLDSVRSRRRPLASIAELTEAFESGRNLPGRPRALKALEFSTDRSDSVQESRSRVLIHQLGFPPPQLQFSMNCDGKTYRADFWWKKYRHWGEFDGRGKYLSPRYQNGRTADQIVVAEKRREDAIRRNVDAFSRWEKRDLDDPQRLRETLTSAGLPCEGPRMLPA
ncbi:type IV toxin-antitoxin system AbiEi family antitoxin domain-containing protein [Paramicrobacterium agarici]|uniref:type IV toxin-antitoxin system AbiEi family antitoxin domain-containing protein n=1 Tax=Paramicrobacterium agarici TaxID=630514 RepID=UPI00117ED3C8|nr:type IV toxin-antitoxin system AbiEi family antitoxin domain-containing protein [Microbacterium agarici]